MEKIEIEYLENVCETWVYGKEMFVASLLSHLKIAFDKDELDDEMKWIGDFLSKNLEEGNYYECIHGAELKPVIKDFYLLPTEDNEERIFDVLDECNDIEVKVVNE